MSCTRWGTSTRQIGRRSGLSVYVDSFCALSNTCKWFSRSPPKPWCSTRKKIHSPSALMPLASWWHVRMLVLKCQSPIAIARLHQLKFCTQISPWNKKTRVIRFHLNMYAYINQTGLTDWLKIKNWNFLTLSSVRLLNNYMNICDRWFRQESATSNAVTSPSTSIWYWWYQFI